MSPLLPPPDVCDRARAAKDPRFDGLFFTAVRSTRIYCRPVCPAPAPKRQNIQYYASAAAAGAAGFRPCLRCRPELAPGSARGGDDAVARALALIADGALESASVDALASTVGIGSRQLRRLFLAHVGATPVAVHATRRLLLAKQLLTETALPVTAIAHASGFRSLRRFNAAFVQGLSLAPTAVRRQARASAPPRPRMAADVGFQADLTLRLAYRPPLDFPRLLAFLRRRAITSVERVGDDDWQRVCVAAGRTILLRVSAEPQRPELRLELAGADARAIPGLVRRVRRVFDLDADPGAVDALFALDPLLAHAVRQRPGLRVPGAWDGFELAVRAVLGQQVSVAGATTLARRLVDAYGGLRDDAPAGLDRTFPDPAALADAPLEHIGLPASRARTLRALAAAVLDGRVSFAAGQRRDVFVAMFTALPGIGAWTAEYVAMRALGDPDAFPAGDLVLQQVLGGAEGRLSERATAARALAWRPWRAYAVMHLWQMADALRDAAKAPGGRG